MQSAGEYAVRLLSVRRYTKRELQQKLKLKQFGLAEIEETLARLEEYGYINDTDYAARYVKDAYNIKKKAKQRIEMELRQKGIAEEAIEQAFAAFHPDELTLLRQNMQKRFGCEGCISSKQADKMKRYYASRGYKLSHIIQCMKALYSVEADTYEEIK